MLEMLLPYVVGGVLLYVGQRFGIKVPLPAPVPPLPLPKLPDVPEADKPAVDFASWLLQLKAGRVLLDPLDKECLRSIKATLAEMDLAK